MAGKACADNNAKYSGRGACSGCHQQQAELWTGSHHDLAMQHATDKIVLGDYSDITFVYAGITSRFYRKNDAFMVRTDGTDGKLRDYEVKYTFGVYPLQQYLVETDKGRLQALTIAWDARPGTEGGQRWFHLYPDENLTHKDALHWTRVSFNWNSMCAECHSTNLEKNYDIKTDSFNTTWSEINVSCEACHGPASNHITWANKASGWEVFKNSKGLGVTLDERKGVHWKMGESGSATRSKTRDTDKEIEVCAQCHSRRSVISDDYKPGVSFTNHYMPRLLDEGMYFADGQIQDEVYVYGSFLQSKMYHKGVTCSDCHEPHSLQLRSDGNGVCLQCHATNKFDVAKHHHHKTGTQGAQCAECHMPPRTYMVVDPRHDHSMRIPRPDVTVKLGTPNACNQCHDDKGADWALSNVKQWYGESSKGFQRFAKAIDAGREGKAGAEPMLIELIEDIETPDIAKATALSLIPAYLDQSSLAVLQAGLKDDNALVRTASVGALELLPTQYKVQLAYPMLTDDVKAVRIEAARILTSIPTGNLPAHQRSIIERATAEYIDSQLVNAERPEAQLNLGNIYVAKQEFDKAEASYKQAISLDSSFVAVYINLANLYRIQANNKAAAEILQEAKRHAADNADVHHAMGLTLVRQQRNDEAIVELEAAARLAPDNVRYSYVLYAVALNSTGKKDLATQVLENTHNRFPDNRDILSALVAFHRDAGNEFAASIYMNKLKELLP